MLQVHEPWLTQIQKGKKTIEGRKGSRDRYISWIGDEVVFYNDTIKIVVKIIEVRWYKTIYDYLTNENLEDIAPHIGDDYHKVLEAYKKLGLKDIDMVNGFNAIVVQYLRDC